MWLTLKYFAGRAKMPADDILHAELTDSERVRQYKRWVRDYPEVERGPDQPISDHYKALEGVFTRENAEVGENTEGPTRGLTLDDPGRKVKVQPRAEPRSVTPMVRSTDELLAEEMAERARANPTDLKGMPQRIPGQFTGDSMMNPGKPLPGYSVPPMDKRVPGAGYDTHYEPPQKTMEEWYQWLADKGIILDETGQVPGAARPGDMLPKRKPAPPRGQDIWGDLVSRAMVKHANSHQHMLDNDWTVRNNNGQPGPLGMGASYVKTIGDRTHVIVRDDGWIHNSGPAGVVDEYGDPEVDKMPIGFDTLGEAVMHATKGVTHHKMVDRTKRTVEDSSYHPERTEKTAPMDKLKPEGPGPKGWYQTLSSRGES